LKAGYPCVGNKDYEIQNYIVTFYPGQMRYKLKLYVIDDEIVEENEYYFLNISSSLPSYISIAGYGATKIIIKDDDGKHIIYSLLYI